MHSWKTHGISDELQQDILAAPSLTFDELEAWYDKIGATVYQTQADYDKEAYAWYLAEQRMLLV
jgi:hypothetical protein